jgi:calcineurin-like phosphoesterase family protein
MISSLYDCFKHWSNEGSVYVYSDPHFDDKDCLLMNKNWPTPTQQIEMINSKVKKNDTLIILGDIGNEKWVRKIKGYKVLIAGNHDKGLSNYRKKYSVHTYDFNCNSKKNIEAIFKKPEYDGYNIHITTTKEIDNTEKYFVAVDNNMFDEVFEGPLFISSKIVLSHEPIDVPFALNIHGHCHNSYSFKTNDKGYVNKINVASDVIHWIPQNLNCIIKNGMLKPIPSIHRLAIEEQKSKI